MILTNDMLAVAFQYREMELWNSLADNDIFAFRLSDGEVGYCCVMGNGGEHFALGFYRGQKGFNSYLMTIRMNSLFVSPVDMCDMMSTMDYINCDFMQAADMNAKAKKIIRRYAETHGLKINRSKGWPDYTRHVPGKISDGIVRAEDASDIVEAMRAAIAVAEALKKHSPFELGFDEEGEYPTLEGGKQVPYLIPNADGSYDWSTTELPASLPIEWPEPLFGNDILANKVKNFSEISGLQLRAFYLPAMDNGKSDEIPLTTMLLCMDAVGGGVFPVLDANMGENQEPAILTELANWMCNNGHKPNQIEVADNRTELLLKDFCRRCDIPLVRRQELKELEEACLFMINTIM